MPTATPTHSSLAASSTSRASACASAFGGRVQFLKRLHRAGCRFQLDQRSAKLANRKYSAPTHFQLYACCKSWPSTRRKRLDTRRLVTSAATATASSLTYTDIWQWRKAQLHKIALFTGPALSIPLADPIMSLVDTVCVGQVSKITVHLLHIFLQGQTLLNRVWFCSSQEHWNLRHWVRPCSSSTCSLICSQPSPSRL